MWLRSSILALACCAAAVALADGLSGTISPGMGGGIGFFNGGIAGSQNGGGGATGCTNQLVLDYSNSCALIAQGWGQ